MEQLPVAAYLPAKMEKCIQGWEVTLLEVMLANVFTSIGGDSRDACAKFFQWGQSHLNVPDPADHSADLSAYLSHSARTNLLSNMRSTQNRAAQANAAEAEGNH